MQVDRTKTHRFDFEFGPSFQALDFQFSEYLTMRNLVN